MSIRPCCDSCDDELSEFHGARHTRSEEEHHECSPFFSCGSCVGFVYLKETEAMESLLGEQREYVFPPYVSSYPKDISGLIWQPPRLS